MQVILLEKINHLGQLGDVVKVKDGYARNFLIPQRKARRATETALAEFAQQKAVLEAAQADKLAAAQALGAKLNGFNVKLTSKSGVDGRLFGSITNLDLSDALQAAGFNVAKRQIILASHLKTIGDHEFKVTLHPEVTVSLNVSVYPSEEN
jgi:large subunit ribosomal protein L9